MARRNTVKAAPVKQQYFILDKNATHLGPLAITDDHRKNGVMLTDNEAAFFTASGTLSTRNPAEDATAASAVMINAGQLPKEQVTANKEALSTAKADAKQVEADNAAVAEGDAESKRKSR